MFSTGKRISLKVKIGKLEIGGGSRVAVQSMTNTDTKDVNATVSQIKALKKVGADLVRISLYDLECVEALKKILPQSTMPIAGDIHYDHRIALEAIKAGIPKIRLNPGNIGDSAKVSEVAKAAKDHGTVIRVGANSGSLKKEFIIRLSRVDALCESALEEVRLLEKQGLINIVVAVKSSDLLETIEANRIISKKIPYPLHIGVTEAGPIKVSLIKSTLGIGTLLMEGIGDTIRYSVSADPVEEIYAGKRLLIALGMRKGPDIISCPTCARTNIDVEEYAERIADLTASINKKVKIAIMGCAVNGIGEGKEADIGIAGTKTDAVLFKKGEIIGTFGKEEIFQKLLEELKEI